MTQNDILKTLLDELHEQTISPDIDLKNHVHPGSIKFEELRLDSLDTLMLAMNVEEKLGLELEVSEFPRDATLDEFAEYLFELKNQ
ncbi:acyl carrier protein [Solemya velum gill symbiont]|uniref:Carrier domain-containing protein n=1 Tax=Solemya velum gill symbiont TaxID=2340 RepID=A0A0B0H982_SOVGS|nr:phosphopantetheine-binding protein [Solemya velum gill symbiont]KHF24011.1 hypothetical protein JV46_02080 [Solemya velum gill symbiont]OOY35827.1 hypothetical protein BOV88_01910 [Solemya velum gill symbiont]OOY38667.1 hypothetical protein BOV89_00080 [Solemya velum gill symbiont]OOY40333.1 hypothetical protein BOV90_04460 [Solemya velum gill symbiont]OOY44609.1 hypothetical protein BOV91_00880 [Solemya velum gill symbiont]